MACRDCKIKKTWCNSQGGSGGLLYDIHRKIVRTLLHTDSDYAAGRELSVALNMPMLSENTFYKIAKSTEKTGIEKYEKLMEKSR